MKKASLVIVLVILLICSFLSQIHIVFLKISESEDVRYNKRCQVGLAGFRDNVDLSSSNFEKRTNERKTSVVECAYDGIPTAKIEPISLANYEDTERLWHGMVGRSGEIRPLGDYPHDPRGEITDVDIVWPTCYQGETQEIYVQFWNPSSATYHYLVAVNVIDSNGNTVYDSHLVGEDKDAYVSGGQSKSLGPWWYTLPHDAATGTWHVLAGLRLYPWDPELDYRGLSWCEPEETFSVKPSAEYFVHELRTDTADYDQDGYPDSVWIEVRAGSNAQEEVDVEAYGILKDPNGQKVDEDGTGLWTIPPGLFSWSPRFYLYVNGGPMGAYSVDLYLYDGTHHNQYPDDPPEDTWMNAHSYDPLYPEGYHIHRKLTVSSAHDSPIPGVGDSYYDDGQSVTCSVTSPVTEGGVTYYCTGWTGIGSVPSSGTSTSTGPFTIYQDSSITWNWQTGGEGHARINYLDVSFDSAYAYEGEKCYVTVGVHNYDAGLFGSDLYVKYLFYSPRTSYIGFQTSAKQYVSKGSDYTFPTLEVPVGSFYLRYTGAGGEDKVEIELWWDDWGTQRKQDDGWWSSFPVLDEDTYGPNIYNIQVTEYNGDGDLLIEDDEQVKISWSLDDASGIYETKCSVDGSWQSVQGSYYVTCGPYSTGSHLYKIYATDNDDDPYHSGDRSNSDTGSSPLSFNVADDDVQGPAIENVQVSEYNGNGDGIIRNDEQVKISWSLSDPSGIYSTSCKVDGTSYICQGSYYIICEPLGAGSHSYEISATDDDTDWLNDRASSSYNDCFEVYELRELGIEHKVQRKDTYMLSVGNGSDGEIYDGLLAWDRPHPDYLQHKTGSVLDDNYCARACISMIVSYYGKRLSQDRISYYYFEEWTGSPSRNRGIPEGDLGEGSGMPIEPALYWALNGVVGDHISGKPDFSFIIQWIDSGNPIIKAHTNPDGTRHVVVIDGYDTYGNLVHILDPWYTATDPPPRRDVWWACYDSLVVDEVWWVPSGLSPKEDEPSIWADSDDDGVYDFDEINRFHTDPNNPDTDGDGVKDKQEIISYTFLPNYSYDSRDLKKPDSDNDHLRNELDWDSDNGGVRDGLEDKNENGFFEPALGETDPLDLSDDPNAIHLESMQDNSTSFNLGTIKFDVSMCSLPNDVTKPAGTYQIEYNPVSDYKFDHWEVTDGISVADPNAWSTTATVTGDGTLRAIYIYACMQITFNQTGVNSDFTGTIVVIDGVDYKVADLPILFTWSIGFNHTFFFGSPLEVTAQSKRYIWTFTAGLSSLQSDSITVTTYGYIEGNYETRYCLTLPIEDGKNATIEGNVTITNVIVTGNALHFNASGPAGSIGWVNLTFPMVNTTEIKVSIDGVKLTPPPFPIVTANGTHYFIYFEFTLSTHNITIQYAIVDIAATNVMSDRTVVGQGFIVRVNATLQNQGDYEETFNVTIYADTTEIGKQVITLTSETSTTITFTWNTSCFARGNYTIKAVADTVLGEMDISDNNSTESWILITKVGDFGSGPPPQFFKFDGKVDSSDLALFIRCYKGLAPPGDMYLADLGSGPPPKFFKPDGKVDSSDLALFIRCYKGLGPPYP